MEKSKIKKFSLVLPIIAILAFVMLALAGCNDTPTGLTWKTQFEKSTYYIGETLDVSGGVVNYTDDEGNLIEKEVVPSDVTNFDTTSFGEKEMTVTVDDKTLDFSYTVKNLNRLLANNRRVSPLTGLPGNVQIHAELKKRIAKKEPFSVLYLDLDNFKAYNDVYGFVKGDQIIEFTAETILNAVHSSLEEEGYVGHIGGDDFVAILPSTNCEKVCQEILAIFDSNVKRFFTERDIEKGYIEVENRKGIIEQFPLTSLSIGVVVADPGRFHNILEIGEVGAQVKHAAKSVMGSSYAVDRRK